MNGFVKNISSATNIIGEVEYYFDVPHFSKEMQEWINDQGLQTNTVYDHNHYSGKAFLNHAIMANATLTKHYSRIYVKPGQRKLAIMFLLAFVDKIVSHNLGDHVE